MINAVNLFSGRWFPLVPEAPLRSHLGLFCAGLTVPIERKRELYAICAEHDVVIIEDDPYYYLQFGVRSAQAPLS